MIPLMELSEGWELDNRTPGKVSGWIRFFCRGKRPLKVTLDLERDFHEDIRWKIIRLSNPNPSDRNDTLDRETHKCRESPQCSAARSAASLAGLPLGPWTEELAEIRW
jgi:hypothetical protein